MRTLKEKYTIKKCKEISLLRMAIVRVINEIGVERGMDRERCIYALIGVHCQILDEMMPGKDLEDAREHMDKIKSGVLGFLGEVREFK